MAKCIRNGKVGIILASEPGTKWFTAHKIVDLITDRNVIAILEDSSLSSLDKSYEIEQYCDTVYGERAYYGDSMHLEINWIDIRSKFKILVVGDREVVMIKPPEQEWMEA